MQTHPHLPEHTWYFIAATTLTILGRPDEIGLVFKHALGRGFDRFPVDHPQQILIARRLREALLKASAVGGVPKVYRVINC